MLVAVSGLHAQLGTGTISGTLTDSTGAVVVGANVIAVNTDTGFRRQTVSNSRGEFALPNLVPGVYDVTMDVASFKKIERKGLVLQVGQNARIDAVFELGSVTEVVEITAQAPLIESQNASLGAVVDTQKILALPLNGRNFVQLALLVPGTNTGAPGQTTGGGFSVSGNRSEQNAFQMDGTSNTDAFDNNINITPSIDVIQEFKIQTNNYSAEFGKGAGSQVNIVTKSGTRQFHASVYEFLRNNATQARRFFDTNSSSFPCDKNDSNVATRKACAPPFHQNQFGFALSGPVRLSRKAEPKTFFLVGYEGFRLVRGNATVATVPTIAQRNGDFSQNLISGRTTTPDALGRVFTQGQLFNPFTSRPATTTSGQIVNVRDPIPGNIIKPGLFDPVSAKMLANTDYIPLPNAAGSRTASGNIVNNYLDGRSVRDNFDQVNTRIDRQFSERDTVFGRFSYNDANTYDPLTFPGYGNIRNQRNLNGTLSYTRIFTPTTLNEFRFGYQGWFQTSAAEDHINGVDSIKQFGITGLAYSSQPALLGSTSVGVAGFANFGNGGGPLLRRNNTFQLMDGVSFSKGRHFMKVGFEVRRVRENVVRANNARGSYNFGNTAWSGEQGIANTGNALANFEMGVATSKSRSVSDWDLRLRATEYGAYFQDDYKLSQRLTLNIGLRYSLYIPPKDTRDQISTLIFPGGLCPDYKVCATGFLVSGVPNVNNPLVPTWGLAGKTLPRSLSPVDKKDYGPRFGFAYRPFGGTKTVVRGGYGIFFDTPPMILSEDTIENYPKVIEDQQQLGLFQNGLPPSEGHMDYVIRNPGLGLGPISQFIPGPNVYAADFRNAYVQSWNFGIQKELPGQMVIEATYVGTKATRLNQRQDIDAAEPLGIRASIGDLTNDPRIPNNIGLGRNQFRLLVPYAQANGIIVPLADIFTTVSHAMANYNGLQMRFEKRYSHGLSLLSTYSFSKAMSNASGFQNGGNAGTGNRVQNYFDSKAEKGLADLDHRQRFTTAAVYDLPFGKNRHFASHLPGAVDKMVGGWAIDTILTVQTGYPITVTRSGDPGSVGTSGSLRPDLVCNPNLPADQQTPQRFFNTSCFVAPETLIPGDIRYGTAGRGVVTGPGVVNADFSLRKTTEIKERMKLEFRAEVFNAFNHANFICENNCRSFGTAQFGQMVTTLDPRIIQFGLKFQF
jgi:hypothetical protein